MKKFSTQHIKDKIRENTAPENIRQNLKKPQTIISISFFLLLFIAILVIYLIYGDTMLEFVSDREKFKTWLDSFGVVGQLVFVGIRALQTVVKIIPAEPLEIGSGYVYGTFYGCFLCICGTEIGSLVIILLSKIFGSKIVEIFVPREKITEFSALRDRKRINGLLWCIYLIPGTPKDLITYLAYFLPISIPKFLIITGIARIPSIISSTWCGESLEEQNYLLSAAIFGGTLILSLLGIFVYKKIIDSRENKENIKRASEAE